MTSICSGSPRRWASTRRTVRCCAAITGGEQAVRGRRRDRRPVPGVASRGERACRRFGRMGRSPVTLSRSPARAAGWPGATPPRSGRSGQLAGYQVKTVEQKRGRWGRFCGSRPPTAWSAPPAWLRSRRRLRSGKPGSRRCGSRRGGQDRGGDRPGQPVREAGLPIILLISRLGLRGVDVRRLEFADFDWPGNRLFVTQAKTGHRRTCRC